MIAAAGPAELTFSVVIPCRNEEANVIAIAGAVIKEMEAAGEPFDLIFIDNASEDRTVELIREMCARDPRIKLIANVRNFGQLRSPAHAIYVARGKAVIALCADFQDPPTLIGTFIDRWQSGADIVLGVRRSEKSPPLLRLWRDLSYRFAARFGDYPIVPNATGFGLFDRKVVRAAAALNEPEPLLRGILVETGYELATVAFDRPERAAGKSNNNIFTLIDFAVSSLSGASKRMLRTPLYVGALIGLVAGMTALFTLYRVVTGGAAGAWLAITGVEVQFGVLFGFLGLIGDQLRIISERTRGTPLVIERERINFPADY